MAANLNDKGPHHHLQNPSGDSKNNPLDVAIVGGGIAGLYCLYQLAKDNKQKAEKDRTSFRLYEYSDHLGG